MGVSEATFYNWRKKYKGLGISEVRELRLLRDENRKLKQLVHTSAWTNISCKKS